MDGYSESDLRVWAEHHASVGCPQAAHVLRLLDERDAARAVVVSLADRVFDQSEILSQRAEKP